MSDARLAALTFLEKCRRANAWSDAVLGSVMDSAKLDGRDRGLCTAICYGVMQNLLLLDNAVSAFSSVKVNKLEPKVLDILRISAYQLLFMDRIPPSAAVNEAVKLSKKLGYARASGLVNAVLRKISANKENLLLPKGNNKAETLSLRYSHPKALVEYFISVLGEAETEELLKCHNGEVPLSLQVNTLKTERDKLLSSFAEKEIAADAHPSLPGCIILKSAGAVSALPGFGEGEFYVQDCAAFMAVLAADPKAGERIIDVCSAPGGKSFAASILSEGKSEIISCDIHDNKLKRIRDSALRLGFNNIKTIAVDGREFREEFEEAFDLVIADVPCSGLGVIRKKPDIRFKSLSEFDALPSIQKGILENVSRYVKRGGRIIYSTCTVREEENKALAEAFLTENTDFVAEDFNLPGVGMSENGMIQLWPQRHGTDGFFIAKFRRK
ncbi:MAG: 16S rRNA (cytosine(967)-C(5))-methyltransferase RsmB [Ruminococcaceae bacterium]|nr:16S rRNA (cytosine(967)-C(5))-methyltransferase RsmB [Oscillospiraceae bacterium]